MSALPDTRDKLIHESPDAVNRVQAGGVPPLDEAALETVLYLANRHRNLSSLTGSALHDVRDALNAMVLHLELLSVALRSPSPAPDDLASAHRSVAALRRELERFGHSVRPVLEQGRISEAPPALFSVSAVVDSVAGLLKSPAQRQSVAVTVKRPEVEIEMIGRREEIHEAAMSLAVNALDAMPQGGALRLDLEGDRTSVTLTISDTGRGVTPSLDDALGSLSPSTNHGRHGLGLHVARRLVEAHGGTMTAEAHDLGARFILRLPRHR